MFILYPTRSNPEANKLIALFVVFGLFIASAVVSCNEVRYTVSGKTTDVPVDKMFKVTTRDRSGDTSDRVRVNYTILEPGGQKRIESDSVSLEWFEQQRDRLIHEGNKGATTVSVQYLPGSEGSSRLVGNSSRWVMIPFALAIIFLTVITVRFWRDFNEHQRRMAAEND